MPTQKQIEAARINGAKSHGPVTPEGKQASSTNAIRHGLLSGSIVLKGESIARFEALYDDLLSEHQPATQSEIAVVNVMAAALWRQLRVWGFEKLWVDTDIANQDRPAWYSALNSYVGPHTCIGTLLRYETAYSRQFSRAQKEIVALNVTGHNGCPFNVGDHVKTYFFGHPPGPIGRWISPPKQNSSKWVDPVAVPTADQALAVSGTGRSYRRCECSETLIRHASPNLGVALPVIALTMTVELSAPFALLVSMVCSTALASSRLLATWLAAIPLSSVATGAHCEYRTAVRGATGSHAENGRRLVDRASHSGIMA